MKINPIKINNTNFGSSQIDNKSNQIADVVLSYRKPFKNEIYTQSDYLYLQNIISNQIKPFIKHDKPIPIVIVGFPMKSPSPLKTISKNADRAEYEALKHLTNITKEISNIHSAGAKLDIYSDGQVFVDTIQGSSDENTKNYVQQTREFLEKLNTSNTKIITLEDIYHNNPQESRKQLLTDFAKNKYQLNEKIKSDPFLNEYKTFMRDFYAKDIRALNPQKSKRQSKQEGEQTALGVIYGSQAYDKCINTLYKDGMLRLSIHAKPVNDTNKKIGIYLTPLKINCPSPWHGAAVEIPQKNGESKFVYEKKSILESSGYELITDNEKGNYYKHL